MTQYLFDASAIVNLIKKRFLAFYECLNAIWREFTKLKQIDKTTALQYIETLILAFRILKIDSIKGEEAKEVFELASKEDLTIYDASYLYAAIRDELTLVTDDQQLRNRASRYVKTLSTEELLKEYHNNNTESSFK